MFVPKSNRQKRVRQILSALDLSPRDALFLDLYTDVSFAPEKEQCLVNSLYHAYESDGVIIFGWVLWEAPERDLILANFHTVVETQSKTGVKELRDVTPRVEEEKSILFARGTYIEPFIPGPIPPVSEFQWFHNAYLHDGVFTKPEPMIYDPSREDGFLFEKLRIKLSAPKI